MRRWVQTLFTWVRLYAILVQSSLKARATYRLNYVLSIIMQMLLSLSEFGMVLYIVHHVHSIGGWNVDDITFLFGLVVFSTGIYRLFASDLHDFDKYLVNGEFDAVLTRPAPALLTLMARSIDVEHAGRLLEGAALIGIEFFRLGPSLHWNGLTLVEIVYAIVSGSLVWLAMVIAVATVGFWTTRIDELQPVFLYGPETAISYPLTIYPKAIQLVFYSVMPIGFGSFIPASLMLHKGLSPWLWSVCGAVSVASLAVAILFWSLGIRRYTSTGT